MFMSYNTFIHPELSAPKPLATTDLFTISIVFPFTECHTVEIIQYTIFSDYLFSISSVLLKEISSMSLNGLIFLNISFLF